MRRIILLFCLIAFLFFQCSIILQPDPRPVCTRLYSDFDKCFSGTFGTGAEEQELFINLDWVHSVTEPVDYCQIISGSIELRQNGSVTPFSVIGEIVESGADSYQAILTAFRFDDALGREVRTHVNVTASSDGSRVQFTSTGLMGLPADLRVYEVECE